MRIDPHVHLRDGEKQRHKETLRHGFRVAWDSGLSGVFEMPNTDPPLTRRNSIEDRLKTADQVLKELGIPLFHGILAGLTDKREQIREAVRLWREYFPRLSGLKMFAGHSTGNMGIVSGPAQEQVFTRLSDEGFDGVLMLHCEKEELIKPDLFDPEAPASHGRCRPPEAEVESVADQIRLADKCGFQGNLHICHVSVPQTVEIIERNRPGKAFTITCGVTPHHILLSEKHILNMEGRKGLYLKMNPPLRGEEMRKGMAELLLHGRISWIETDHAPHSPDEKLEKCLSGIPVLPFYPRFLKILREKGASEDSIDRLTCTNILKTFRLDRDLFPPNPNILADHCSDYGFDPFVRL